MHYGTIGDVDVFTTEPKGCDGALGWLRYGPKRACRLEWPNGKPFGTPRCSACKRQLKQEYRVHPDRWRYCPTCGARVVRDIVDGIRHQEMTRGDGR